MKTPPSTRQPQELPIGLRRGDLGRLREGICIPEHDSSGIIQPDSTAIDSTEGAVLIFDALLDPMLTHIIIYGFVIFCHYARRRRKVAFDMTQDITLGKIKRAEEPGSTESSCDADEWRV
jgi:hypothetical protein